MFDSLSERLNAVLDRLTRRGALSEADVAAALQEVQRALIEADGLQFGRGHGGVDTHRANPFISPFGMVFSFSPAGR